jgi:hypothetical protein
VINWEDMPTWFVTLALIQFRQRPGATDHKPVERSGYVTRGERKRAPTGAEQ